MSYTITELHTQIDTEAPDLANVFAQAADGTVVGILRLEYSEGCAYVHNIFVQPEHRGQKLCTRMLEHAFALCNKMDYATIGLSVKKENEAAQRLYERLGFMRFQQHDGYWQLVKVL